MRGRRPERWTIALRAAEALHAPAQSDSWPGSQGPRAQSVLALATGAHPSSVASRLEGEQATVWRTCRRSRRGGRATWVTQGRRGHTGRPPRISPGPRAQRVELAGLEPSAKGLPLTPWSSEALARQAGADPIVPEISPATVGRIRHDVALQPHRTRSGKTARRDDRFQERAEQGLWCYGNAARLAEPGVGVVCDAEIPSFPVRERDPIRRAIPGSIQQSSRNSTRPGTGR